MKQVFAVFFLSALSFCAVAAPPKQVTVCGVYQIRNSDGMLPVVVKELLVEMPPPLEGFDYYRLSAAGSNSLELDKRQGLLASISEGKKCCVTGPASKTKGRLEILINKVKAW